MLIGMGQTCADGTAYVANFGCDDGSTPTCPSGYTLSTASGQYSCVSSSGAAPLIGVTAPTATTSTCPVGSTCSIVAGISNTNIYLAVGAVVSMFLLASVFGGKR